MYMSKRIIIILGVLLLASLPAVAAQTGYSSIIDDLPLMKEMTEKPDDTVVFDKPAGRIIEITAETSAAMPEIRKFYDDTLPPLGWKMSAPLKFIRDNEMLKIRIEQTEETTLVHFTLTPHSEGK